MTRNWLICIAVGAAPVAHAQPSLSFSDAVERAIADGPTIDARRAAIEAAERSIGPAGRLPDPQLVLGFNDVPVTGPNAGSLTRDDFTMQRVGVMQEVPNRAERHARTAIARAEAQRAHAGLSIAGLDARLGAAQAWLALHFAQRRAAIVDRLEAEAQLRSEAIRGRFGAGGAGVDETVIAAIDAAEVEDRKAEAMAAVMSARAALRRWVGEAADAPLASEAPAFRIDAAHIRDRLLQHPSLAAFEAERALADANVAVARSETRPDWAWEASYGRRDPSFGDLASVGVRIGLPLFQGSRQRPVIEARLADAARVASEREAARREYAAQLEQRLAEYAALSANVVRGREVRLPLARQRAAAAVGAHGAGSANVTQLIDARTALLEAEIDLVDLEERLALVGAALTFEYGETAP